MPNYKMLIGDNTPIRQAQYSIEYCTDTEQSAEQQVKLLYAKTLNTTPDNIEVLSIIKI